MLFPLVTRRFVNPGIIQVYDWRTCFVPNEFHMPLFQFGGGLQYVKAQ
jgi:hypothetical protein